MTEFCPSDSLESGFGAASVVLAVVVPTILGPLASLLLLVATSCVLGLARTLKFPTPGGQPRQWLRPAHRQRGPLRRGLQPEQQHDFISDKVNKNNRGEFAGLQWFAQYSLLQFFS